MGSGELGSGVGAVSVGLGSGLVGVGDGLGVGDGDVVGAGAGVAGGLLGEVGGREVAGAGFGRDAVLGEDAPDWVDRSVAVPPVDGSALGVGAVVAEAVGSGKVGLTDGTTSPSGVGATTAMPESAAPGPPGFACTAPKMARPTPTAPATASTPTTLRARTGSRCRR